MATTLLGGELLGRTHIINRAKAAGVKMDRVQFAELNLENLGGLAKLPHEEAIDFFRGKVPMSARTIEDLVTRYDTRSEAAAQQLTDKVTDRLDDFLGELLTEGRGVDFFEDQVQTFLRSVGLDAAQPHLLETIARTNTQQAYIAGRWDQMSDPAIAEAMPLFQFNTTVDTRRTEVCESIHGRVYRRDNPVIQPWIPPNHFNCRTGISPMTVAEAKASGIPIRRAAPSVQPEPGFRHNPATALIGNATTGMDPVAAERVRA